MTTIPDVPNPSSPVTPTTTHYQQLAAELMAVLDQAATIIPKPDPAQIAATRFSRTDLSVPIPFLGTATTAVEQNEELGALKKLDPVAARDTLQLLEAFRPVLDKVSAFEKDLRFTLNVRKSMLVFAARQIYVLAKGLARTSAVVASHVANMKRDLKSRGKARKAEPAEATRLAA